MLLPYAAAQHKISLSDKSMRKAIVKLYKTANVEEVPYSKSLYGNLQGKFFRIKEGNTVIAFSYLGRVNNSNSEFFDYYALFNTQYRIIKLSIYNYHASHGEAVCAPSWLKQFVLYDGKEILKVGKNIDAISGATISTHSFTKNIQELYKKIYLLK